MKFFKYSVLALALAAGFSACSDDDDFVPGGASAGVYFPTDDPLEVALDRNASSFDVTVARMGETKAATYELVGSADEDVFTLPASVTFAEGETSTTVSIAYNKAEMGMDIAYPVKLAFASGTQLCNYGYESLDMEVTLPAPWKTVGTGTYRDLWLLSISVWADENPDVPIEWEVELQQHEVETNRYRWVHPYGENFAKFCAANGIGDLEPGDYDSEGKYYIEFIYDKRGYALIPPQNMGFVFYSFGEMGVANNAGYEYAEGASIDAIVSQAPELLSNVTVDDEGNILTVFSGEQVLLYYRPETDGWYYCSSQGYQWAAEGVELKDYDITLTYSGVLTTPNEDSYVQADVKMGEDLAKATVGIVKTTDEEAAIAAVRAGEVPVQEFDKTTVGRFEFDGTGDYCLAAIGYNADGEEVTTAVITFFVADTSAPKEWAKIGTGAMIDGWVLPAFEYNDGSGKVNPMDWPFNVDMEENIVNPGVYRLLAPYTNANFPMFGNNQNQTTKYNMVIDARDPAFVKMEPQCTGFLSGKWVYASQAATYFLATGRTETEIADMGLNSILKDGVISIPLPLVKTDASGDQTFGGAEVASSFYDDDEEPCPTLIQLPGASQESIAKVRMAKTAAGIKAAMSGLHESSTLRAARKQLAASSPRAVSAKAMKTHKSAL